MANLVALRKLSHALRNLRPDFNWDYDDDCKCALAVAVELGFSEAGVLDEPFGLTVDETDHIFYNDTPGRTSPMRVAGWIDDVVALRAEGEVLVGYGEGALAEG